MGFFSMANHDQLIENYNFVIQEKQITASLYSQGCSL